MDRLHDGDRRKPRRQFCRGTCRPSHYHVLRNDAKFTPDELHAFTFDLCHLYAIANKIVSRPAPVYYAHRAAFLGPYYSRGFKADDARWETGSTSSHTYYTYYTYIILTILTIPTYARWETGSTSSHGSDQSTVSVCSVGSKMQDTVYYS